VKVKRFTQSDAAKLLQLNVTKVSGPLIEFYMIVNVHESIFASVLVMRDKHHTGYSISSWNSYFHQMTNEYIALRWI
jgi:hypothetical protein